MRDRPHTLIPESLRIGITCLALLGCVGTADAEDLLYSIEVPDGEAVGYSVPMVVEHPGTLRITVEWSGGRVLALRLDRPDGTPPERRAGPSPIRFLVEVDPVAAADPRPWFLRLNGLAGLRGGEGLVTIQLPSAPVPEPLPRLTEESPQLHLTTPLPEDSPAAWINFAAWSDALRTRFGAEERPDACRWQDGLVGYLEELEEELATHGEIPDRTTRVGLERLIAGIREVQTMRESDDPIVAGPVPEERKRRKAWLQLRYDRMQDLESLLDEARLDLERGHAPELDVQDWPVRLISCVAACQRYFEQEVRLGSERAMNRDLATEQWERILLAADTLQRVAALVPDEPTIDLTATRPASD